MTRAQFKHIGESHSRKPDFYSSSLKMGVGGDNVLLFMKLNGQLKTFNMIKHILTSNIRKCIKACKENPSISTLINIFKAAKMHKEAISLPSSKTSFVCLFLSKHHHDNVLHEAT